MSIVLYVVGIIVLIISFITGFRSDQLLLFIISGFLSSIIFFALGKIIDNQEEIKYYIKVNMESPKKSYLSKSDKKVCSSCHNEYDVHQKSCPYCGNKD
ncbi:hypothetical protein SH1V18_23330 [Vallitalea longa]|uniref:Uncharacterized protein n=1 Tax=Vallitalea longa TaxID=2936439 RepID=A0A9W6DFW6_9FIRM|nr:hypothetical protein [Vallitalea longa]GKX29853.1 hypothetical protein SH1V18_23330 [Vallitalea longa]